nr:hypothetical protein [Streptomyces graminilatus]
MVDLDVTRDEVTEKTIRLLSRGGWYEPGRDRQRPETRTRMREVFGLARGFEVGAVLEVHHGRPRITVA